MKNMNMLFEQLQEDWEMMQKTAGDEGADWAERFEKHFYEFINEVKKWFHSLETMPKSMEEAEELPIINSFLTRLPAPLQLNFLDEVEDIIEGNTKKWYD